MDPNSLVHHTSAHFHDDTLCGVKIILEKLKRNYLPVHIILILHNNTAFYGLLYNNAKRVVFRDILLEKLVLDMTLSFL